jgi:hypothetical protein
MESISIPFVFSTPVWGAGHVGLFLNVGLPSLLAPGNLPGLTRNPKNRYLIYTQSEYEKDIRAAYSYQRLADILAVEIIPISKEIEVPHRTMSDCHGDSLRRAEEGGAATVFIPPDCLWSDGSMVRLEALARSGKSVVHMSGIRLDRDGVVPELADRYSEERAVLSLAPRDLVGIGLRHLHPIAHSHFFNEHDGGLMPANLAWSVGGEGLLLRCFHLHPLMVKPQGPLAEFKSTIDDDLALRACPDSSRDYVVTDSDELLAFEMSPLSHAVGTICRKGSIEGIVAWAEYGTNSRHRELIRHCIRVHSGPLNEQMWRAKEIESAKVIDTIDELGRLSRWQLLWRYPTVLIYLLHATMLGRVEKAPPLWLRSFGWVWSLLRKIEGAFYHTLFMKGDSPRIAHPSWLIRRGMRGAAERSIRLDDRHIVVVADDPGLGREVARSHPDIVVQSYPVSATPDQDLVRRSGSGSVSLLVAVDLPIPGLNGPRAQRIGERRVLLRLSSDRRDFDKSYNEIVYFGGLGTRFCWHVWQQAGRLPIARKTQSLFSRVALRLVLVPLSPVLYPVAALAGSSINSVGMILDFLVPEQSASYHDEEAGSLEPST